jgi:hypothetical protein
MNKNATTDKENQDQNESRISRDEVAQRAHQLWEAAGQPIGREMEYWLQAEGELLAARQRGCLSDAGPPQASLKLERSRPRVSAAPGSEDGAKKAPMQEQNYGDICLDAEGSRLCSAPVFLVGLVWRYYPDYDGYYYPVFNLDLARHFYRSPRGREGRGDGRR